MSQGARALRVVVGVLAVAAGGAPPRAAAGPCPPEVAAGCKGFLKSKHLTLAAVLGSGVDAAPLEAVGVTPDGKIGYGLRSDGALDEWDLHTGALRRVAIARFIGLDPGGRWAIAPVARKGVEPSFWSSHGSGFELWDLASRRRVATTKAEWEEPLYFEYSRRRVLIQGFMDDDYGTAIVWDTASGKARRRRACPGAALTPDGTRAVCASGGLAGGDDDDDDAFRTDDDEEDGGGVVLRDLDRDKVVRRLPARAAKDRGSVVGLAVSPDGGRALVAFSQGRSGSHTSIVWNLATGKVDKGPDFDEPGGDLVRWSPAAGKWIWIGSEREPGAGLFPGVGSDKHKTTWLGDPHDRVRDAVFLPDGKRILTGSVGRGVMRLVATADGRELRASREDTGHLGDVLGLSISRDGNRLLSCGKDHTLRLWDLQNSRALRSIALDEGVDPVALMTPDGAFAVTTLKGLSLITLPDGTVRQTLIPRQGNYPPAMSPDGGLVLVGQTLWEIPSGREVWSNADIGGAAAFSADQRRIYAAPGSYRTLINVIDAGSGVVKTALGQTGPYGAHGTSVLALAPREDFIIMHGGKDDPAFRRLAGEWDGVARFDVPAGRFAWTIASRHYVRQVVISPDGRWFVITGSLHWGGDKQDSMKRFPSRVELRSTADGTVADAVDLDSAALVALSAAFTPDGRALIIGTEDGPILRFAITP